MRKKRFKNIVTRFICIFGTTALVAVAVTGCDKKVSKEKVLSDVNDNIEEVEIEEKIKEQTFEKDGITYKKILGQNINFTYPLLEGVEYKEKVNDALVNCYSNSYYYKGASCNMNNNEDVVVVDFFVSIEPFYFDESHSKLLSSTEEVSYITYQLYNARAYLYTSMYGLSTTNKKGIIPRDESVLGLSEPTEKIPDTYVAGKFYDIASNPVSLIDTDFQCGDRYEIPTGDIMDCNTYLAIQFIFEESAENCTGYKKTDILVAEEINKAILEAEIHYKSGETEKKYVGFKSFNSINPTYYDVYTVEIK